MIQTRGASPALLPSPRGNFTSTHSYETISDLMNLQDQIESFQKLIFALFRHSVNNECRISALVPLVKESYNIYRFITSMLRAMHRRTGDLDALEPLRARYNSQHHNLRKFYFECSNLKYLTGLINVPKLGADPPNLLDNGQAPELPKRPTTAAAAKAPTPPPAAPSPDAAMIREQAAMLKEYEDKQRALEAQKKAEEERRRQQELQLQMEMGEKQRQQAEREQEQLHLLHLQQFNDQNAHVVNQLQMEMLGMRGQYERDQIMLEQYDRVRPCLSLRILGCRGLTQGGETESQGARGRVARDERRRERADGRQGRADQATAGPGDALAEQVRGARQALLPAPERTPRHAQQAQAAHTQGQFGPGGHRQDGAHGEGRQDEEPRARRYDQRTR